MKEGMGMLFGDSSDTDTKTPEAPDTIAKI